MRRRKEVRLDFEVGDAVKLKEGRSPVMMVSAVVVEHLPDHVECKWYSNKEETFKFETFHKDMLKPYEKKEGKGRVY